MHIVYVIYNKTIFYNKNVFILINYLKYKQIYYYYY